MSLKTDIKDAVNVLEQLQTALVKCDDPLTRVKCHDDLNAIMFMLKNPMLNKIVSIQEALQTLKEKVAHHPSLLPEDFDITTDGELVHSVSVDDTEDIFRPAAAGGEPAILPPVSTKTSIDSQSHFSIGNDDEFSSSNSPDNRILESLRTASVCSPQKRQVAEVSQLQQEPPQLQDFGLSNNELTSLVERCAEDKEVHHIMLSKPEGTNLGFSVVGLKSEQRGDLGIFIKDIQHSGIAGQDGRLQDGDQILAIDGQIIDAFISHQNAISILQNASNIIDLYVARDPSAQQENEINNRNLENQQSKLHPFSSTPHIVPPSSESHTSNMLNTEWAQVEVIFLVNDGSGLGFGIIGGRSTGVVVKTILPGGVADRDERLQPGDHILQIGDVNLRGLGSDQVASVLRQASSHVRLVVARPVESASPEYQDRAAPIVETRVLNNPEELERHLLSCGDPTSMSFLRSIMPAAPRSSTTTLSNGHADIHYINGDNEILTVSGDGTVSLQHRISSAKAFRILKSDSITKDPTLIAGASGVTADCGRQSSQDFASSDDDQQLIAAVVQGGEGLSLSDLPEMESIEVAITKDYHGLGITIAGYVCEREELSGIFVKSVNVGSAADRSGRVQVNDQIIEVDGHSLSGMSNHAAVEVLKATSKIVVLKLVRYLRGPKFEQLQQAIANSELKTTPSTPNPARSSAGDLTTCDALRSALVRLEDDDESSQERSLAEAAPVTLEPRTISPPAKYSTSQEAANLEDIELLIDNDFCGRLKPAVETAIQRKWCTIIGEETDIVVAQLTKFEKGGGLGISLEGTVDVEDGKEVRPHHYIRSILPDGPVGKESSLKSGDELLEVNNRKLFGLNHLEVVAILKELPQSVRLVCGRRKSVSSLHPIDAPTADRDSFAARNILGGSLQNLLPANDRLVKAKSDGSLASSIAPNSDSNSFSKVKSRSLEPLSGLAMWSTDFQEIELIKGERGLGFSILDYQDPINPHDTVIVIRSLVPGGVAEKDGQLIPGDRLIAVNGISLENSSLDTAVAALKGAPRGVVQISVAKPVSVLESPGQLDLILGSQRSDNDSEYADDSDFPNSDSVDLSKETVDGSTVRRQSINISSDSPDATQSMPPVPAARTSLDRSTSLTGPVVTERLIGGNNGSSVDSRRDCSTVATTTTLLNLDRNGSDSEPEMGDEGPSECKTNLRLSSTSHISLQETIVIAKAADHIGISYEFDNEMNGIIINSIRENGAVFKDGRLRTGDLVVAVSGICFGNRTDSEIKSILRNSQLDTDISITYVPLQDVSHYKELIRHANVKSVMEREALIELSELSPNALATQFSLQKGFTEAPLEARLAKPTAVGAEDSEGDRLTITFRNLPEAGAEYCPAEKSEELSRTQTSASDGSIDMRPRETLSKFEGKHWGPERRVDVKRDEKGSLGISIVGGKVDLAWNETSVSGIFIKNVLPNSPAGKSALLKTGDRILEVEGTDLRNAPHEKAVEVIKKSGNSVCFVVQSLIQWAPVNPLPTPNDESRLSTHQPEAVAAARTPSPELIQIGMTDEDKQELQAKMRREERSKSVENDDMNSSSPDDGALQGHVLTLTGQKIDRFSAGAIKLTKEEKTLESEDVFGYTKKKIEKKYKRLDGEVVLIDLLKEESGIGITLSGHKDRTQMAAFVCGINPSGTAFNDGRLRVGDEILEVNGNVLQGISHLNASKIFRQIPGPAVKIIIRRTAKCLEEMAVKPITQFPVSLEDESPEEKYSSFNGLAKFILNKGQSGLGIMIIEGKHADYGQGIFISDLQEGSIAAEAGLMVGDMILCVNKEDMVRINYEEATNIVKRLEGIITMWVANAARVKPTSDGSRPQSRTADISRPQSRTDDGSRAQQSRSGDGPRAQSRAADGTRPQSRTSDGTRPQSRGGESKKPDLLPKPVLPPKPQSLKKTTTPTTANPSAEPTTDNPPSPTAFGFFKSPSEPPTFSAVTDVHANLPVTSFAEEITEVADPHTAEIIPSKETVIEIIKEKMGLGLSIVGGSDTLLGAIIIHEVYPDGAASKDGRLNPGDQILEVNNENFRVITHQKALNVLRQTPSKVRMVVYREESAKEENLYDIIDVQLTKKSGKGLGLSIVGRKTGKGVFISDLVPGGVAESDGRLMQGDQILEVNDKDLRSATQEQAAAILKCAPGFVSMKVGRLKPGKNVSFHAANATWPVTISDDSPRNSVNLTEAKYANVPLPQQAPLASALYQPGDGPKAPVRQLLLDRGDEGLGFSIVGGFGSNLGDLPIYVKSVFEKGAASKEGSLRRGDQILEVNGISLNGLSHAQAVAILKESRGTVTLIVLPSK